MEILIATTIIFAFALAGSGYYAYRIYGKMQQAQFKLDMLESANTRQSLALNTTTSDAQKLRNEIDALKSAHAAEIAKITNDNQAQREQLEEQRGRIATLESDLQKRPERTRVTYSIITLGIAQTGKTSLTLRWANPLTLGSLVENTEQTQFEAYERTVSTVHSDQHMTDHVFEIRDWGGEYIDQAHEELHRFDLGIRGMLFVVDLGRPSSATVDEDRIAEQIDAFNKHVLRYFFSPAVVAKCQTVVLFINKSDLLSGRPEEIDTKARAHFRPLIQTMESFADKVELRVIVGSSNSGHNVHHLFAHFIEKILPKNAYDKGLLQKIKMANNIPPSPSATMSSVMTSAATVTVRHGKRP